MLEINFEQMVSSFGDKALLGLIDAAGAEATHRGLLPEAAAVALERVPG